MCSPQELVSTTFSNEQRITWPHVADSVLIPALKVELSPLITIVSAQVLLLPRRTISGVMEPYCPHLQPCFMPLEVGLPLRLVIKLRKLTVPASSQKKLLKCCKEY